MLGFSARSPPPDESQYQSEYEEEQLEGALSDMDLNNHCGEHTGEEEETCDTVGRDVLTGTWGEDGEDKSVMMLRKKTMQRMLQRDVCFILFTFQICV